MVNESLLRLSDDFEVQAENLIDKYFTEHEHVKDMLDVVEKRLIIKELAFAGRKTEIVRKLNGLRRDKALPELAADFDIYHYQLQYAPLIESLSLHYASNLAKRFRFANKVVRVAKLNDLAEFIFERIQIREESQLLLMGEKEQKLHNESIKIFVQLVNAIDEQMGKLPALPQEKRIPEAKEITQDVHEAVRQALQKFGKQLPEAVEANFSEVTPYEKCEFAEMMGEIAHCWYFNQQCKVQTNEFSICPHFVNRVLLHNKKWMTARYSKDEMSANKIAELAGCQEIDERVIERVRNRLRDFGLWRNRGNDEGKLPSVPSGEVANIVGRVEGGQVLVQGQAIPVRDSAGRLPLSGGDEVGSVRDNGTGDSKGNLESPVLQGEYPVRVPGTSATPATGGGEIPSGD